MIPIYKHNIEVGEIFVEARYKTAEISSPEREIEAQFKSPQLPKLLLNEKFVLDNILNANVYDANVFAPRKYQNESEVSTSSSQGIPNKSVYNVPLSNQNY